ncbi:hypothetical protein ACNTMW_31725 [Planosporangium sp. 12N6]|uniref:hypothetical protein n=1 Tax=Planosporangium spinosum TaxID=3402278 RepID=UPI003CE80E97
MDGIYDTADAAHDRVIQLDRLNRAVRQRLTTPPPTVAEWVAAWLPAHFAGAATTAKYGSMLRTHPSRLR